MNSVLKLSILILFQFFWTISSAQDVTISPEGPVVVREGESLRITCTDRTSFEQGNSLIIDRNGVPDPEIPKQSDGAMITFVIGPVTLQDNGTVFRCAHTLVSQTLSSDVILLVQSKLILFRYSSSSECCVAKYYDWLSR